MKFALPLNIGCMSLDDSPSSTDLCQVLSELELSGQIKTTSLKPVYDETLNTQLNFDFIIISQLEFSERLFSFASHLRSIPQSALRPIFVLCESPKIRGQLPRAKALGLEVLSDRSELTTTLRRWSELAQSTAPDSKPSPLVVQRLFDAGDFPALMKILVRIEDNDACSTLARTLEATLWLTEENFKKAEQLLRRGISVEPQSLPMRHMMARVLARQGKYPEAQIFLEQHMQFPFLETISLLGLARIALESSDYLRAEQYFRACHQRDNSNPEAELGLGKIAFARGDLDKASEHFVRAGHCNELASYFNQMAIALVNQRRFKDALFIYQNALKVLPSRDKHHFIHYNIGLAQKKRGALLEAADAFATSLNLSPGYEKAQQSLREVLKLAAASGGDQLAFEQYKKLLA